MDLISDLRPDLRVSPWKEIVYVYYLDVLSDAEQISDCFDNARLDLSTRRAEEGGRLDPCAQGYEDYARVPDDELLIDGHHNSGGPLKRSPVKRHLFPIMEAPAARVQMSAPFT